jgi:hypothetical protein
LCCQYLVNEFNLIYFEKLQQKEIIKNINRKDRNEVCKMNEFF